MGRLVTLESAMLETCLVLSHPGHELRLFGWMEIHRPVVCILTDGSGNTGEGRISFSRAAIGAAGAILGPVMGPHSDRRWYQAILAADSAPFLKVASTIADTVARGSLIVSDPVEGYNPMHDLCSAVADLVAAKVGGTRAVYALMDPLNSGSIHRLGPEQAARKRLAVEAYTPLRDEGRALLHRHPDALFCEQVSSGSYDWPEMPETPPQYEAIGHARIEAGLYREPISYAAHVRPMALRLRHRAGASD
jgi:hypothetical protein